MLICKNDKTRITQICRLRKTIFKPFMYLCAGFGKLYEYALITTLDYK